VAADFSPAALDQARNTMAREGSVEQVTYVQADLLDLPFPDHEFTRVLCFSVLTHIPQNCDGRRGTRARACAWGSPGRQQGNMLSFDDLAFSLLNRVRGRRPVHRRTPSGVHSVVETPSGQLFIRHTNVAWLVREFERHGLVLRSRRPGQFSEAYALLPGAAARRLVHRLNAVVQRRGRSRLAFGTVLVLERPAVRPWRASKMPACR
jgi:hypothetical protein